MSISPEIIIAAQNAQRKWNVWASVTLAQFGVESAWGKAMPAGSNNPFGIKAIPGRPSVSARTREVINGRSVSVTAQFAKFKDFAEAFDEHAKLLATSHYYAAAMRHAWKSSDPSAERFIDGLGSYATDPNYRETLKNVCRQMELYKYDTLPGVIPAPAPSIPIPPSVPAPVANWIIFLLNNVFSGSVSTAFGIGVLVYAFFSYHHIPISNLPLATDWQSWVLAGLTLIFGVSFSQPPKASTSLQASPQPQPQKETDMATVTEDKFLALFELLLPLLKRALSDVPMIKQDIDAIKNVVNAPSVTSPDVEARLQALHNELNALHG